MNIYVSNVALPIEVLAEIIKKFRKETYVGFSMEKVVSPFPYSIKVQIVSSSHLSTE